MEDGKPSLKMVVITSNPHTRTCAHTHRDANAHYAYVHMENKTKVCFFFVVHATVLSALLGFSDYVFLTFFQYT